MARYLGCGTALFALLCTLPAHALEYESRPLHLEVSLELASSRDGSLAAVDLSLPLPHGPDNPLDEGTLGMDSTIFLGLAIPTLLASLVFAALALGKNKKMNESVTRSELKKHHTEQTVFGVLGYTLFGTGGVFLVLNFALK